MGATAAFARALVIGTGVVGGCAAWVAFGKYIATFYAIKRKNNRIFGSHFVDGAGDI